MVEFLVEHPQMAQGYIKSADARQKTQKLWERLTEIINAEGPPVKESMAWKKVWADFKTHRKSKLRKEQKNIGGTGGGKPPKIIFTALEEKVIATLQLRKTIFGTLNTKSFGVVEIEEYTTPINLNDSHIDYIYPEIVNEEYTVKDTIEPPPTPRARATSNSSRQTPDPKQQLLEQQVNGQQAFHEKLVKILSDINQNIVEVNKSFKRIAREQEKQTDLLKIKIDNKAKYEVEKTKRHAAKLEQKRLKLAILENKYK